MHYKTKKSGRGAFCCVVTATFLFILLLTRFVWKSFLAQSSAHIIVIKTVGVSFH